MSQKKVDSYKAGKAGRSKASRKEKLIDKLEFLHGLQSVWQWLDGLDFPRMQRSRQNRSLLLQRQ